MIDSLSKWFILILILALITLCCDGKNIINIPSEISTIARAFIVPAFLIVLARFFDIYQKIRKFECLEGKYVGYSYENDNDPTDNRYNYIGKENGSTAEIKYSGENILSISVDVTRGGTKNWIGTIQMDSEYIGYIPWEYIEDLPSKFRNGLKKCIIFKNRGVTIHLCEILNKKYGREVFKKV